jgi:cysteine sulfinate desulfinase/cysteine desulfurase-like protein
LLYSREINLRRRFEEVIQELERVRDDLQFHQDVAWRVETEGPDSKAEDRIGLTTCATRCGNSLRRQSNELTAVAESFEEIVLQLINNAIPPQQLAEAMRKNIVRPLLTITEAPMDMADRSVSEFRVAATSGSAASSLVAASVRDVSSVIGQLRGILGNVRDMAEFHEALRDLKDILEEQQRILNETKKEQINNLGF